MPAIAFQAPSRISLLALLTATGAASSLLAMQPGIQQDGGGRAGFCAAAGVSRVVPRAFRHRCNIRSDLNDLTAPVPLVNLVEGSDPAAPVPKRVLHLRRQLENVHKVRRTEYLCAGLMAKIGRTNFNSPTYKKLFTHETWANYTGRAPEDRWRGMLFKWRGSSIARAG